MCQFCHQHGEGKKWDLNAANYAEELFTEAARKSFVDVERPLRGEPMRELNGVALSVFERAPWLIRWIAEPHQRDVHWGQVVPLEDALQVVDMLDWVIRLPCTCRASLTGNKNARYCFGIGFAPLEVPWRDFFRQAVDPSVSLETLTREQAKQALTDYDRQGAMHSVWTFKSPYIGGLCNCDRDCQAHRYQTKIGFQVMYRAEYVAQTDPDQCTGCRRCMQQCLFGAIQYSLAQDKCAVDQTKCYGCGVCRSVCQHDAISLVPRESVPAAAGRWGL
jgi:ferredoxin